VLQGVFVTGTDTGIGKTVVSAAMLHRYRGVSPVRYWKPIQTGVETDSDTREVRRLGRTTPGELLSDGIRLRRPLSPHLAARLSGASIDVAELLEIAAAQPPSNRWIVEGAGGVLVPINDVTLMIDLIGRLTLATLVVARATLGTINHTLLTIEALRARSIPVAGVVMVGKPNRDNREAIEAYGRVPVVGELPKLDPLTPSELSRWAATSLDPEGRLLELFR
jgi:dethiobiotin synthase